MCFNLDRSKKRESFNLTPIRKKPSLSVIVVPPVDLLMITIPLFSISLLTTSPERVLISVF